MDNNTDIVTRLRRAEWYCNKSEEHMGYCNKKCARRNLPSPDECRAAANEIERLRAERDEARLQTGRILNEIDCRIEHGADSNGHLEAIYNLFKENTND